MNSFVLALGSNIEPRHQNLIECLKKLSSFVEIIKVAPVFENPPLLPPEAPDEWYRFFLNTAVLIKSDKTPEELLKITQKIEQDLGRTPHEKKRWAPRAIDIDILFSLAADGALHSHSSDTLSLPHPSWLKRNFVLAPLLHLPLPESLRLKVIQTHRQLSSPLTSWVAILNVTPDSFSNAEPQNSQSLLTHFRSLLELHPAQIDIGAESTRPGATALTPEEEWDRLFPFLDFWRENFSQFPFTQISLDTYHPKTAQKALDYGVQTLNDVSGLSHPGMQEVAHHYSHVVLMHSLSIPANPQLVLSSETPAVHQVEEWFDKKISNLPTELHKKLILDPGLGFGKTSQQSLALLQSIDTFKKFSHPILIGASRKSFMNLWSQKPYSERDPETLGVSSQLWGHVEFLRVHNLEAHQRLSLSLLALDPL